MHFDNSLTKFLMYIYVTIKPLLDIVAFIKTFGQVFYT